MQARVVLRVHRVERVRVSGAQALDGPRIERPGRRFARSVGGVVPGSRGHVEINARLGGL